MTDEPAHVPTPTGGITPGLRKLIVICAVSAAVSGFCALGLSLYSASNTRTAVADIQTLLLNGKTASAISAKKTAKEVKLLLAQQSFDHKQTLAAEAHTRSSQKRLQQIEAHTDRTIRESIAAEAAKFAADLKH